MCVYVLPQRDVMSLGPLLCGSLRHLTQDLIRDLQTKLRESMLTLRRVRSQLACTTGDQGPDVSALGESRV
jgi:hypothetical protein